MGATSLQLCRGAREKDTKKATLCRGNLKMHKAACKPFQNKGTKQNISVRVSVGIGFSDTSELRVCSRGKNMFVS